MRYIRVRVCDLSIVAVIQPMWPIEEYAMRGRICDWFIPPIPPTMAPSLARTIISLFLLYEEIEDRTIIGATFCHVVKIMQEDHLSDDITCGNQK